MKSRSKPHHRLSSSSRSRHQRSAQRATIWTHLENAFHVFHDYYIPHHGNNHKPKIWHKHSVRTIAGGLLALKLALVVIVFSVTPAGAWLSPSVENEMLTLTNEYRVSLGAQALTRNSYLDSVARVRAQDMIDRNYFSHYTPDGKKPWEWVDSSQYNYDRFGENLAADFVTAKAVLDAFKLSPSHDKNVRNPAYRDIGIATVSGQLDGRQTNIMVVFYASLKTPKTVVVTPAATPKSVTKVDKPVASAPVPTVKPSTKPARLSPPPTVVATASTTASSTVGSIAAVTPVPTTHVEGVENAVPADTVTTVATQSNSWLAHLFSWSTNFYFLAFIAFLMLAAVNIFVSFRVQHHSAIIASFFLIILAGSLWALSWHGFELVNGVVSILGVSL